LLRSIGFENAANLPFQQPTKLELGPRE